ncbi:MAG: hypothetical protein LUD72_11805 [Bacteroidales bacterium]|nr:hypothetical protein [Bacteroidales bacterium]
MLLTEDGHLDIERVKQLNEEQLREEKRSWSGNQWFDWFGRNGVKTHEEVFGYLRQKIREAYAKK